MGGYENKKGLNFYNPLFAWLLCSVALLRHFDTESLKTAKNLVIYRFYDST